MYYNTTQATPCAYITQGKHRLKQYGQNVYMKNGSEFELELFNPKQSTVLAKIKINGSYIGGGGIVLRPGERVFLERYLDDSRKFLFETYNVDGTSSEVLKAIQNNGDVTIEFYDEYVKPDIRIRTPWPTNDYWWYNQDFTYIDNNIGGSFSNPTFTTNGTGLSNVNCMYNSNSSTIGATLSFTSKSIETGRIEKGGKSDQKFTSVDKDFNSYVTSISAWKILPESQKPYESKDIKVYCTNCGTKF
jgi:hypothetical protein